MPAALFILGMLSIAMLIWIDRLNERQGMNFNIANALMTIQIKTAASHLWLEEIIAGDTHEDISSVWKDVDLATSLAEGALNGRQSDQGLILEPLKDARLRFDAEEIKSLLIKFKRIAQERYRQPKTSGIGSPSDDEFDKLFMEITKKAGILEDLFEKDHIASHAKGKQLFFSIFFAWVFVVVAATVALWTREMRRKTAEEALEASNEQLSRHELHLLELVNERTVELTRTNEELRQKIVECRKAEEVIRNSEERYRLLFNSGNDAVFVHRSLSGGLPGHFIEVNDIACKRLGYSREELLRMSPLDINAPDAQPDVPWIMEQLDTQGCAMWEGAHMTKEGRRIPVEINNHRFDFDGRPIILATVRDITERKQAEEERHRVEAQLRQAQKMEAVGTLAGGIAHDFNNILGIIMGYTQLAMFSVPESDQGQSYLKDVLGASHRAKDLIMQILAFSRKSEQERQPTQIGLIIKEALKMLRASLPTTIEIKHDVRSKGVVLTDPTQIHQVLMNLCTNAAHAMRETGGVLEVSLMDVDLDTDFVAAHPDLHPGGAYLSLTVKDTGHGIDAAILERIFDPYFTTKPQGEGTGLGLSVVHGIVKGHGGTITVRSDLEKGTAFEVYFPKFESSDLPDVAEADPIPTGRESLLFVDDEEGLCKTAKGMLERLEYQVTVKTSPVDALEAFREKPDSFDLVITDLTMPHMTGIQMAKEMLSIRASTRVILCSGFSEIITSDKAKATGIREFLLKPLIMADLGKAVRRVLDEDGR